MLKTARTGTTADVASSRRPILHAIRGGDNHTIPRGAIHIAIWYSRFHIKEILSNGVNLAHDRIDQDLWVIYNWIAGVVSSADLLDLNIRANRLTQACTRYSSRSRIENLPAHGHAVFTADTVDAKIHQIGSLATKAWAIFILCVTGTIPDHHKSTTQN